MVDGRNEGEPAMNVGTNVGDTVGAALPLVLLIDFLLWLEETVIDADQKFTNDSRFGQSARCSIPIPSNAEQSAEFESTVVL